MSNYKGEIGQSSSLIHDTMNNQFAKKIRMKKSPHLVLKKFDGFGNVNNKLFIKDINNIGNGLNNDEGDNNIKKFVNNKEIKMKMH